MNAIVEIDKAGRIVIPKKMRDALHLTPGTRLSVEQLGDHLTFTPSGVEAQLVIENGTPLIVPSDRSNAPVITVEMINELIAQGRLERERRFMGLNPESE